MIDDDNDGLLAFPWPLWIPAASWFLHGVATLALLVYTAVDSSSWNDWAGVIAMITLCALAYVFFATAINLIRGSRLSIDIIFVVSILLCIMIILVEAVANDEYEIAICEGSSFLLNSVLCYMYRSQWARWAIIRRQASKHPKRLGHE